MKKVLIVMGRYLPGYKDGGPVRSIKNLVDALGNEYDIRILTNDRDHEDTVPYSNINLNSWNQVGKAKVWYVQPNGFTNELLIRHANQADIVYVCGCFDDYSIKLLLLNRAGKIRPRLVIASMGLFSPKAFALKSGKKQLFVNVFKTLGCFERVTWSVTSQMEEAELKKILGNRVSCVIAQDLPRQVQKVCYERNKVPGSLKICFISRISRKKNLSQAIRILKNVAADVCFDIYGPKEDDQYWKECEELLRELPENVRWNYYGMVESERIVQTFSKYHVFLFPTLGENYGHVIHEALSAGCLCLISDQTPWQDFEESGVGAVFQLQDEAKFAAQIERYSAMDDAQFSSLSEKAVIYADKHARNEALLDGYRNIFSPKESVLFLTNIPSPYRVDFFNELGKKVCLTVVFDGSYDEYREKSWLNRIQCQFETVWLSESQNAKEEVRALLGRREFTQIIVGTYSTPIGQFAVRHLKMKKRPFAISVDGGFVSPNENPIKRIVKSFLIGSATYWLSSGTETDKYLLHYGARKDKIYHYPFTSVRNQDILERPLSDEERQRVRSQLGITERQVFLAVGQFINRKGFDLLLKVSRKELTGCGVYFVGGEPTQEYLKLAEDMDHVHFVGFKDKNTLNMYYDASDVFVLPTREDIWGLVINEAMARGVPIITTDRCLAGCEMISDGNNGWIIEANSETALQEGVRKALQVIDDKDRSYSMRRNAIQTAKQYSIEAMVDAHLDAFKEENR